MVSSTEELTNNVRCFVLGISCVPYLRHGIGLHLHILSQIFLGGIRRERELIHLLGFTKLKRCGAPGQQVDQGRKFLRRLTYLGVKSSLQRKGGALRGYISSESLRVSTSSYLEKEGGPLSGRGSSAPLHLDVWGFLERVAHFQTISHLHRQTSMHRGFGERRWSTSKL